MVTEQELREMGEAHIPQGYDFQLYKLRHSAAHIMAQAVEERFKAKGPVRFGIGPPIESGFYYDFELPRAATEEDLHWIEARMQEIISEGHPFKGRAISAEDAKSLFADQPFKLELIEGLTAGEVDENGNPIEGESPLITVWQHSTFADLCRGPHVEQTSDLDPAALKLLNTAGAYWRGDEKRPMLTRIYGTIWRTQAELEEFLWRRSEAERRDHRRLGKELELFHFEPTAPGMPYWLPKGLKLLNTLIDFWREEHENRGYQEISSPLLNDKQLWEISGHWEHYRENMFLCPIDETTIYGLKPMNCPNAMVIYNTKVRSYRDLPLRLSDCDILHRNERSGTLHGLLRVQRFQQDDAHIFITEEMIEEEYQRIFDIADRFYRIFQLDYTLRLGTRPEKYVGEIELWDRAEAALIRILEQHAGPGGYQIEPGDGAFYGPKIDIIMRDVLGRPWQMGTIQLDFNQPRHFGCKYTRSDGQLATPVVIHRVIYGSLERFIGILIEHTAGAFPLWLAPVQVAIIPVADRHNSAAAEIQNQLKAQRIRSELRDENERLGAKVRSAQVAGIPYALVIGDREVEQGRVSIRARGGEQLGDMPLDEFIAKLKVAIEEKRFEDRL